MNRKGWRNVEKLKRGILEENADINYVENGGKREGGGGGLRKKGKVLMRSR